MSLKIVNLKKNFEEKIIFDGFSYDFADSGIYLLKGESGVGKTTLLRIIAGLDKDYEGKVVGGGVGRVGVAFQEYRLFPQLTALQNLTFVFSETKSEAECKKMLLSIGLSEADFELYPEELSGGMKQRVSLARAFLSDYPVLLLDEPTKELDDKNAEAIREIIKTLSKNRLFIIVSHNDEDVSTLQATEIFISRPN